MPGPLAPKEKEVTTCHWKAATTVPQAAWNPLKSCIQALTPAHPGTWCCPGTFPRSLPCDLYPQVSGHLDPFSPWALPERGFCFKQTAVNMEHLSNPGCPGCKPRVFWWESAHRIISQSVHNSWYHSQMLNFWTMVDLESTKDRALSRKNVSSGMFRAHLATQNHRAWSHRKKTKHIREMVVFLWFPLFTSSPPCVLHMIELLKHPLAAYTSWNGRWGNEALTNCVAIVPTVSPVPKIQKKIQSSSNPPS